MGYVEKYCREGQAEDDKYSACALHAGYLRLQIHTLWLRNSYCFATATMVTGKHLIVKLYVLRSLVRIDHGRRGHCRDTRRW